MPDILRCNERYSVNGVETRGATMQKMGGVLRRAIAPSCRPTYAVSHHRVDNRFCWFYRFRYRTLVQLAEGLGWLYE